MSTAIIKSLQVSGSTVEVLAVADDGNAYRVQTDGTTASLKAALQQATAKSSDIRTKPELFEGMTVDFTPDTPAVDPLPTKEDVARTAFFADLAAERTTLALSTLSPELRVRYRVEYGALR